MPAVSKEKKVQCTAPNCTSKFTRNSDLKRHTDTCHEKKRLFKCDRCDNKYFQQASHLKTHMNQHNGTRVNCDSCTFSCTDPSSLSRHRRIKHSRHAPAGAQAPAAATPAPPPVAAHAAVEVPANIPAEFMDWDQSIAEYPYLATFAVPSMEDSDDYSGDASPRGISTGRYSSSSTSSSASLLAFPPRAPSMDDSDDYSGDASLGGISTGTDLSRPASSAASSASSFPPVPALADFGRDLVASQPWNLPAHPSSPLAPPASAPEDLFAPLEAPSIFDDALFDDLFDLSGGLNIDPDLE